jgi:hypothetical protein
MHKTALPGITDAAKATGTEEKATGAVLFDGTRILGIVF